MLKLIFLSAFVGVASAAVSCSPLSNLVNIKWCNDNCNHVPAFCPSSLCACAQPAPTPLPNANRAPALAAVNSFVQKIQTGSCSDFSSLFASSFIFQSPSGATAASNAAGLNSWCAAQASYPVAGTLSFTITSVVPAGSDWRQLAVTTRFSATVPASYSDGLAGCVVDNTNIFLFNLDSNFKFTEMRTYFNVEDPNVIYKNPTSAACIANLQKNLVINPT